MKYAGLFDADDILQVTFLEAFLRISTFEPRGERSFLAWLRQIAENNIRDAVRELERDKRLPPDRRLVAKTNEDSYAAFVEQLAVTTSTPSRSLGRKELCANLDGLLASLPPEYETVLRLYELEELPGAEVAERMGRSPGAVRMLLARARERLAEAVVNDPRFFSST